MPRLSARAALAGALVRSSIAAALTLSAAAGCSDDSRNDAPDAGSDATSDGGDTSPDTAHDVPDNDVPPVEVPLGFCQAPSPPRISDVDVEQVFTHAFPDEEDASRITHIVASPFVDGEWYAVKHKGWIIRFSENADEPGHEVVLDLRDGRVSVENDEAGIVSLAFHPTLPYAVLAYQAPTRSGAFFDSVISRFDVRDDGTMDPDSELELIRVPQPFFPHSVDHVVFDADGLLYATFGDGGTVQSRVNAQDTSNVYGSMIRIDVSSPDEARGLPYSIPADNPFADGVGGTPELFAWGLRNTWRFSIDRQDGTIWGGDVGENSLEEINHIRRGGNYGWPIMEGDRCFEAETCNQAGLEPPIVAYPRNEGISVTGGFVYRGTAIPSLIGRYVYADYLSGLIWSIDAASDPGLADVRVEAETGFWISSFGEDRNGELYVVRWSQAEHLDKTGPGGIYRLVNRSNDEEIDTFPTLLSQTGCMSPDDVTQVNTGLRPFVTASALWSDAALKDRYLSLPEDATIEVDDEGNLLFPEGTVVVKNFRYGDRLHETRLYIRHAVVGWRGYTYRWRDDLSDADLLPTGLDETLPNGVNWRYPSRGECARCHTAAAAYVLGLEVGQLRWSPETDAPSQLQTWLDDGLFVPSITVDSLEAFPPLHAIDSDASVEERARSYLHSNCSGCHRPGGPPQSPIDLRYSTAFADMGLCNATPFNGTLRRADGDDLRIVVPGDPDKSILFLRMTDPGQYRMPPLGTHVIDEAGSAVVREWIEGIADCP